MVSAPPAGRVRVHKSPSEKPRPPHPPGHELGDAEDQPAAQAPACSLSSTTAQVPRSLSGPTPGPSWAQPSSQSVWGAGLTRVPPEPPRNSTPGQPSPRKREGGGDNTSLLAGLEAGGEGPADRTVGRPGDGEVGATVQARAWQRSGLATLADDFDDTGFHGHRVWAA